MTPNPNDARQLRGGGPRVLDDGTEIFSPGDCSAVSRPWRMLVFVLWFAWALATSSGAVLHDLVTPGNQARSGIARIRLNCRTDGEVTMLSSLITLTPGTLTLGTNRETADGAQTDPDGHRLLYVHALYADDADALRTEIHDMERRMLHALRKEGIA